jgi:GTP-binding protein
MVPFGEARFFRAVHKVSGLPPDRGAEIAFAGRSNAGKSSAINALTGRKRLAFATKTPGRTQAINFFSLGAGRFLVDLPGYGYAKVSSEKKHNWEELINTYILTRASLRGLVLITDARRPLAALDRRLLDWIATLGKPAYVLVTKADKLNTRQAAAALLAAQELASGYPQCSVQLFSATTGIGLSTARAAIAHMLRSK